MNTSSIACGLRNRKTSNAQSSHDFCHVPAGALRSGGAIGVANFSPGGAWRPSEVVVMTYAEKLKDPRWQQKRLRIFERDEWKCRDCGSDSETLTVHHCHYSRGGPWETPDEYLLTLCEGCHEHRQVCEDKIKRCLGHLLATNSVGGIETVARALEDGGLLAIDVCGPQATQEGGIHGR
jgi:hypothetical protein